MSEYEGIKGLTPREPIGAVVTIGIKDKSRGFPTQTDRWHIVQPKAENNVRKVHEAFRSFNTAAVEKRQVIRGNLIHATKAECFEHHLKAQVLRGAHPNKKPACVGDGVKAMRWEGQGPEDFMEIKCLNELCEYRQTQPPKCKPFMRFLFRLRWPDGVQLPTPLVKFTSGAWNTTANFLGFWEYLEGTAAQLGLHRYTLFGFPFLLSLHRQTKPSEQRSFPVVTISPEMDPIEFFMKQRDNIRQLSAEVPAIAITDQSEQAVDAVYEDVDSISVPGDK